MSRGIERSPEPDPENAGDSDDDGRRIAVVVIGEPADVRHLVEPAEHAQSDVVDDAADDVGEADFDGDGQHRDGQADHREDAREEQADDDERRHDDEERAAERNADARECRQKSLQAIHENSPFLRIPFYSFIPLHYREKSCRSQDAISFKRSSLRAAA